MLGNSRAGKTNYMVTLFHQLTMLGRSYYDIKYEDKKDVNTFLQNNDLLYTPNEDGYPSFSPNTLDTLLLKYNLTYQNESFLEINSFDYKGGLTKSMADGIDDTGKELSKIIACNDIALIFLDASILNNNNLSDEEKIRNVDLESIEKILFNSLKSKVKFNNIIDVSLILTKIDLVPQEKRDALCSEAKRLFILVKGKIQNELKYGGDLRILGSYGVTVIGDNKTISGAKIILKEGQKLEPKNVISSFFGTLIEYRKKFEEDLKRFKNSSYDHQFWKQIWKGIKEFFKGWGHGLMSLILSAPEYLDSCWKKYRKNKEMTELQLVIEKIKNKETFLKMVIENEH